jgi:hypothetical protein
MDSLDLKDFSNMRIGDGIGACLGHHDKWF